jgi:hypothetical protein
MTNIYDGHENPIAETNGKRNLGVEYYKKNLISIKVWLIIEMRLEKLFLGHMLTPPILCVFSSMFYNKF